MKNITAAVYVGTYHKYNSGSIAGEWVSLDAFVDKQEFITACTSLHKDEADPELMFQDWEGIPESFINESWVDSMLWTFLDNDSDYAAKVAFIEHFTDWDEGRFEEAYQGEFDSELEFTYQLVEESGMLADQPDFLQRYFDYEAFSRDLFISDYSYCDGFVFRADI